MKLLLAAFLSATICPSAFAADPASLIPLATLESQARARTSATARVPLAPEGVEALRGVDSFEAQGAGRVPNYLRALAAIKPAATKPFAHLLKTFVYAGSMSPALKLAMALRIAQVNRSPYTVAHVSRLLHASGAEGDAYLAKIRANQLDSLPVGCVNSACVK